jgi:hypothetical protein
MGIRTFTEPCVGEGRLLCTLIEFGFECVLIGDIQTGQDALTDPAVAECGANAVITNPPWSRPLLHAMILRFMECAPVVWLLFDADWSHTKQARPFLSQCSHIVSVGRVKWIEDSKHSGKDNAAWYCFQKLHTGGPKFYNTA